MNNKRKKQKIIPQTINQQKGAVYRPLHDFKPQRNSKQCPMPQSRVIMRYCADCGELEYTYDITTRLGENKSVCRECLREYPLNRTKIRGPKFAGVML